eukprot:m.128264 g.128264  ORF g.128264 m.128264 type:complete len:179 (+) comp37948_c0_seq1:309-845(+)
MIRRGGSFRCRIASVHSTHIVVEHRPWLRDKLPLFSPIHQPIRVDFGGIVLSNMKFMEIHKWLEESLLNGVATCQLLGINEHRGLDCLVYGNTKKLSSRLSVNEQLLRKGFAIVRSLDLDMVKEGANPVHQRAMKRLLKAEKKAAESKIGVWNEKNEGSVNFLSALTVKLLSWLRKPK